ncbi:unnamed protein product [Amoebophrya sp. A25]|nr:unnamed protein product [Amoebophrya sp. A25]|eukprot:GSA25T00000343001.1
MASSEIDELKRLVANLRQENAVLRQKIQHGDNTSSIDVPDTAERPQMNTADNGVEDGENDEAWFRFWPRALWLVGLLALQSTSSFVLASFKELIERHPSIVYFLTMLVGAGGNAGGQAVVYAVRRLALRQQVDTWHQCKIGLLLAVFLAIATGVRTAVQRITSFYTGVALSSAMFFIVFFAVTFGTLLPQIFHRLKIDPAHASATIQVAMDIIGITIVCIVATLVYEIFEQTEDTDTDINGQDWQDHELHGGFSTSSGSLPLTAQTLATSRANEVATGAGLHHHYAASSSGQYRVDHSFDRRYNTHGGGGAHPLQNSQLGHSPGRDGVPEHDVAATISPLYAGYFERGPPTFPTFSPAAAIES